MSTPALQRFPVQLPKAKNLLFLSDIHLQGSALERTRAFLDLLASEGPQAGVVAVVGDLFDFWFGYRTVVFREYVPVLARLLELREAGVAFHYWFGNHDFDLGPFFVEDLAVESHERPCLLEFDGMACYVGHGDEVDRNKGYRFLYSLVRNKWLQRIFRQVHPDWGAFIAGISSRHSRSHTIKKPRIDEASVEAFLTQRLPSDVDVAVQGHSHRPALQVRRLADQEGLFLNLGDFLIEFTYARYSAERGFELMRWDREGREGRIIASARREGGTWKVNPD